ncbi:zinc finger protein 638-like [Neolamprologus brichardi]|uniref:zinc finger protein 638-like n=1 Tax=Neolamprologus brichardi TaxID=32507 RepID=UPI001643D66C|nr:zinc finger protein 638-like [Neolamprologus brichardi]
MSHPLHNPYNFGIESSAQCRNALSSSGAASGTSDTTLGTIPSLRAFPVSYNPPQSSSILDGGMKRSTEMYLGQARTEMRQQPVNQAPCFTGTQEDKFISSTATVASSPVCSASQRHSDFKSGTCSLDWSIYKKATENDSSRFFSSSTSLSFQGSGEREQDMQSIPGLGDSDYRMQDKPVLPTDSSYPKYSSQEASNILLRFGLEKDDLEYLISYPEDQITPGNLPFILRQIRMKKAENVKHIVHSKPCPEPQPTPSMTVMDRFRREGMQQGELAQIIKPSKVIDYGHTSKYAGGFGSDIGKSSESRANSSESGSMLLMDTCDGDSCNREPLQEGTAEVKTSTLVSSHDHRGTVSTKSSMQSYEPPPSRNLTQRLLTQPHQASQEIISSFSLPKKDTDLRLLKFKPVPLKEPEPDCHLALKIQPPLSHIARGVHHDQPGLVLIGNKDNSCTKDQSKSQQQAPKVAKPINNQKMHQRQMQQELKKQAQKQQQQDQKQPPVQMGQCQSAKPATPLAPQIIPKPVNFVYMPLPLSSKQCRADRELSKVLPALAMMQDYAAATPQTFPHTCSLCLQKCTGMKEWLLHQNTSFHLDNCKLLRKRYPQWDGKVLTYQSASNTGKKSSSSTSGKTSQHRHQKTRRESHSRSRSHSPRRRLGLDDRRPKHGSYLCSRSKSPHHHYSSGERREKLSSGSQSPNSSRRARRSRSRSFSPRKDYLASLRYQSHSRSRERRSSPGRRDGKQLLQKRSDERRLLTRRQDDKRLLLSRSHKSSSSEKRPQQKKLDSSTKRLAKQLLETTGLHSLSKKSDLEAIAETIAPVILAELAKMKSPLTSLSSSASTSSSSSSKKAKTTKSSESKPGLHKSEASTSSKPKASKSFTSTMVKLHGIVKTFSHEEVVAAVEHFGKTESIVLYRSKLEAKVNFMKEEDAQKLKKLKSIDIKTIPVTVVREQNTVTKKPLPTFTKKQQKLPQKKIVKSTKSVSTGNSFKKPLSLSSGDKKNTTGKLVTKAKVLVSKAKSVSTKPISKTIKQGKVAAKGAVNVVEEKKDASNLKGCNDSKSSGKQQGDAISKQRPALKRSESNAKNSAVASKDTVKVVQLSKKTVNPIKGTAIVTRAKVLVAQAQTASTMDKPQSQLQQLAATGTSTTLNVEEITVKGTNVQSKTSEDKPGGETLKPPEMEIKFQQPTVVSEETTKVLETRNATASETKNQADEKANQKEKEVKHTELLESVNTKVVEPMEVESFSGSKCLREPESSEIGQTPPQTLGSSAQAALDTKQTPERIEKGQEQQKGMLDTVHATNVPPKPKASENKPNETFKTPKSDTNVQESAVMPEDRARNVSASEMKQQTELAKAETKEASHTEPLDSGNKKVTEPTEHFTDRTTELTESNKDQTPTSTTEITLDVSPTKYPIDTPHRTQTTIKKTESYKNSKVQESGIVPEKKTKIPETKNVSVSETQQQAKLLKVETKELKHTEDCFEDTKVQDSGSAKNDVDEAMEVEHFAEKKALLAKSSEGQTPASTTKTTPTIDHPQRLQTRAETKEAKHSESLESGKTKGTESMEFESSTDTTQTIVKNTETLEIQKSATVLENTTKVLETRNGAASETKHPVESTSVDVDAKDTKRAESLEIGACKKALATKSKENQPSIDTADTILNASLPKPSTPLKTPLKTPQKTIKMPSSSQIQQSVMPDPESTTALGQKTLQMSGSSTEAALEAKQAVQSVNTVAQQKDLVIAVTSQKDPSKTVSNVLAVSTAVAASSKTEPTAATAGKQQQSFSNLTFGEKIEKLMDRNCLNCFKNNKALPSKVVLITNLPEYENSCYTEVDVANQLTLFEFGYLEDDIYVIPQMRMAFAIAPSLMKAKKLFQASKEKSIILNGSTLCLDFLIHSFPMNPLGFYSTLMNLVNYQQTTDDGSTVIYIKNISPSEANDLREALEKIGSVKNYLPLLNKVKNTPVHTFD